jgi:hypothetical protein
MNIIQTFSSGLDSTALLIYNLEQGNNVVPVYIKNDFVDPLKRGIEYAMANKIIKILQRKSFKGFLYNLHVGAASIPFISGIDSSQPLAWILGCFGIIQSITECNNNTEYSRLNINRDIYKYSLTRNIHGFREVREVLNFNNHHSTIPAKFDECQMAYVSEDYTTSLLDKIKNLYNTLFAFQLPYLIQPIAPKLTFPLIGYPKCWCHEYILKNYSDIFPYLWWCERPIETTIVNREDKKTTFIEPCEHCGSCEQYFHECGKLIYSGYGRKLCVIKVEESINEPLKYPSNRIITYIKGCDLSQPNYKKLEKLLLEKDKNEPVNPVKSFA